jgi:methyl-accepting chemotaxis protein
VAERSPNVDRTGARGGGTPGNWWRWLVVGVWAVTACVALVEMIRRPSVLPALCLVAAGASAVLLVRLRRTGAIAGLVGTLRAAAAGRWAPVDPAVSAAYPELAASTSVLIDRFRESALVLARSAQVLSAGGAGIEGVSEEMSSTAESTAARTASAATTAERVEDSVMVVATSSEELATTIGAVAKHATQVAEVTDAATRHASRTSDTMVALGEASRRIEDVVRVINTIAGQTRMLALNATIEAARAGAAGKGFAVVADEVRNLAQGTAEATESVTRSVRDIQTGVANAEAEIRAMVRTIEGISDSQGAIVAAVDQQTSAMNEIGRRVADVVKGSGVIVNDISALAEAARTTAYGGAHIRTTSGELAAIRKDIASVLASVDVDALNAELASLEPEVVRPTAVTRNGVTYVQNNVMGTGQAEFDYIGEWRHSAANAETDGTNSYSSQPDDIARLRFTCSRVRFYSVSGPGHGIGAASVDGGPETRFDTYSPQRATGVLMYESPVLPHGPHTIDVRVADAKHPDSRYTWVNVDRIEFE